MLGIGRNGPLGRWEPPAIGGAGGLSGGMPGGMPDDERAAWVVLSSAHGIGPVAFGALVAAFGGARPVLEAARRRGGGVALVAATRTPDGRDVLSPEGLRGVLAVAAAPQPALHAVAAAGVEVVTLADPGYPARLRRIALPPPVLFVRGSVAALDRPRAVAIVGTRRPTDVGRATAAAIGEAVGVMGATIVSGLALGIDAAAHRAAVRGDRPTVAVIGGGHLRLYPAAHRGLARAIVATGGAVISEFLPDVIPTRGTFPRRNRLISGLADATVVVEAGRRSGALTTAAWALEQGRGLHLVPGRIDDPTVAGCLAFLREASAEARVVSGIPELIEDLGLLEAPDPARDGAAGRGRPGGAPSVAAVLATLGHVERVIAEALARGQLGVDELVRETGHSTATVLGALTALETRGLVVDAFGRFTAAGPLLVARAIAAREAEPIRPGTARASPPAA